MTPVYLVIPRLRVQGANAQATWWLINSAPVMACTMFGHALGRHLNQPATGVAIIHHTTQLHGEQFGSFRPEQRRGAVFIDEKDYSSKNRYALSLQPTATFSGEFSLIVRFGEMAEINPQQVEDFLLRARLAGGQILEHGTPHVATAEEDLRRQVRSGYWLIDRRDLMQKIDGEDWLDVLLRVTAKPEWRKQGDASSAAVSGDDDDDDDGDSNDDPWKFTEIRTPPPSSWIVATTLGYALLTPAASRAGARDGYPHAFAEPLVGPVQYVSLRQFGDRPLPVWQPGWPRDDVFLLSQPDLEI